MPDAFRARAEEKRQKSNFPILNDLKKALTVDATYNIDADQRAPFASFSGSDITCYIMIRKPGAGADVATGRRSKGLNSKDIIFDRLDAIQTISISSATSVHPERVIGQAAPESFTRGARTTAGSLIFVMPAADVFAKYASEVMRPSISPGRLPSTGFFMDEIPPFTLIIEGTNEYGMNASCALVDIQLSNFGQAFSETDIYSETTYTYTARYYFPMVGDTVEFIKSLERSILAPPPLSLGVVCAGQIDDKGKPRGPSDNLSVLSTGNHKSFIGELVSKPFFTQSLLDTAGLSRDEMLSIIRLSSEIGRIY